MAIPWFKDPGTLALGEAIRKSQIDVIEELFKNNQVDVNLHPSMLHNAVRRGDIRVIDLLIKNGAEINRKENDGNTPLMDAIVMLPSESVAKLLIDKGASLDIQNLDGETALSYATEHGGSFEIIKRLVALKANLELKNTSGVTALMSACRKNRIDVVKFLILAGANIEHVNGVCEWSPFRVAIFNNNVAFLKLLLEKKAMENVQSAFMYAVGQNFTKIVDVLIEEGADVNHKAKTNCGPRHTVTPLMYGVQNNCADVVTLLVERGVEVNMHDGALKTVVQKCQRECGKNCKIIGILENAQILACKLAKKKCLNCSVSQKFRLNKCEGCLKARYCNKECQLEHWPEHKKWCRKERDRRKREEAKEREEVIAGCIEDVQ